MTAQLIERLAREAGLDAGLYSWGDAGRAPESVARFAALVAEHCAKVAECSFSAEHAAAGVRAAFPMPKE